MFHLNHVKSYFLELQNCITQTLEKEESGKKFKEDTWHHVNGKGGGNTRILENGTVIEKAGVNFSHVFGTKLPFSILQQRPELQNQSFQAMGVSVIVHPRNPYAPTSHFNSRFFSTEKSDEKQTWWFGGGFDLTPYYGFTEDCIHWHQTAKNACDPFGPDIYFRFKKACDDYFFLPHRNEPRGIGGLFFDYYTDGGFEKAFDLIRSICNHYLKAYQPILNRRKNLPFEKKERDFQCYRRGRYVEFNLIYDRGTLFGLQSGGRTESILISLPPEVIWRYDWQPDALSEEENLYRNFLTKRDWIK